MENFAHDFLVPQIEEKKLENNHSYKCNYCSKKDPSGYYYKCIECYDYGLCSQCFEKRKSNESHQTCHKVIWFIEPVGKDYAAKSICGTPLKLEDSYLDKLNEVYSNVNHLNIKCNICQIGSIKGLRFKCDSCINFNVCEKCSYKSSEKHQRTHPLVVYCQTVLSKIDSREIKIGDYIGSSGFGKVFKAIYRNNSAVDCKKVEARKDKKSETIIDTYEYEMLKSSYLREYKAYTEIKGENILRMIGYSSLEVNGGHDFFILTEPIQTDLDSLIKNDPNLGYRERFIMTTGIASGMARIHSMGYIHFNIRLKNIFVTSNHVAKIGDMSKAICFENKDRFAFDLVSMSYMPPEFYKDEYTMKLDVFTFGLSMNELFGGKHSCTNRETKVITKGRVVFEDIISKCILNDPNNRPLSQDIENELSFINDFINKDGDRYFKNQESLERRNRTFESKFHDAVRTRLKKEQELCEENRKRKKEFYEKLLKKEEMFNSSFEDSRVPYILSCLKHFEYLEKNSSKCLDYSQKYLNKVQEVFKVENHVEIAASLAGFGYVCLHLTKDYENALHYYKRAANMNKILLGEDCPVVANNYFRIGDCYYEINDLPKALEYYLISLEIRRSIYASDSEYIVNSLNRTQTCYLKLKNMEKYLRYRREEMKIKRELYKIKNPDKIYYDTFIIRGKDRGREAWHYVAIESESKYEELKRQQAGTNIDVTDFGKIIESGWGKDPPSYIENRLSKMYALHYPHFDSFKINGSTIDKSILEYKSDDPLLSGFFSDLQFNYEFNNGEDNLEVVDCLLHIMRYYVEEIQYSYSCILLCDKCLEICERIFKKEHNRYSAEALHSKACYYLNNNEESKACSYFEKVLEMRLKIFGREHPSVAETLFKIGKCKTKQCKINEALESFLECLEIRKKIYANHDNIFIVYVLDEIVSCYEAINEMENFSKYRADSLSMKKELFKEKYPDKMYYDVILVRSKDEGKTHWCYILIENESKYDEIKKLQAITKLNATEFGKIIQSGLGFNPPKSVTEKINLEYGFDF
jgi:serine/threonine protein kinase